MKRKLKRKYVAILLTRSIVWKMLRWFWFSVRLNYHSFTKILSVCKSISQFSLLHRKLFSLKIESRGKWHVEIICWNNFKFFDLKMKFMETTKRRGDGCFGCVEGADIWMVCLLWLNWCFRFFSPRPSRIELVCSWTGSRRTQLRRSENRKKIGGQKIHY